MGGHLRLLNIACAAKAKRRLITLTKPSREAPLPFILLGGSEKGFGIFVDSVDFGSKATEAGLKRGDQVCILRCGFFFPFSPPFSALNENNANFFVFLDIGSEWSKLRKCSAVKSHGNP